MAIGSKDGAIRKPVILATGPSGFPGASQIMCGWLVNLARSGIPVELVVHRKPFALRDVTHKKLQLHYPAVVHSSAVGKHGAVGHAASLTTAAITETIFELTKHVNKQKRLIIWATYLFPFGIAAHDAAVLARAKGRHCEVWLTATGSDIWEFRSQFPNIGRHLLDDAEKVLTYSRPFAQEIRTSFGVKRKIDILEPLIDASRFHPIPAAERVKRRRAMRIPQEAFVISHHSNLRAVKRPLEVLLFAQEVARRLLPRPVHLIISGPASRILKTQTTDPLKIKWQGISHNVELPLSVSDVELNLSAHDSFNLSLAEAMASGVPVITTAVVGIAPHIIRSEGGRVGGFATKGAAAYQDLVSAVIQLARDPVAAEEMGRRGASYAAAAWCHTSIATKLGL